ncbi:metal ABC transporter solute-binding protein, Zn/Mn family [Allobranchiibius huperziae]|uniref:Zinc/manganese transport system substrate-binding protein n=1 Tax=Allobranchiibius huperziae TaxID=1874116 RepID=A0A853DK49_9MICO|nr:zinc ABC transporter substrate-binding protein [Allobranchiibius huperziae]NYJ74535.1 zinc/manganese transport system substrate-binding protein [Allobranchiibius huperziae]
MKRPVAALAAAVAVLVLAGCGSGGGSKASDGKVQVWTSTDVWGSVARYVGGERAQVTSAITSPSQDPHDYESTARDKLAVRKSAVAVYNGGGYDDWAQKLVTGDSGTTAVDAVTVSGLDHGHDPSFNEHVFWSLPTSIKVADVLAADLAKADPAHAAYFRANARSFATKIGALTTRARSIGVAHPHLSALMTEPVVGYLLSTAGIADGTPATYREQSEADSVSAVALRAATTAISTKRVQLVTLNAQTSDATSAVLQNAADKVGVPVVQVYETFPAGEHDYLNWVLSCITTLQRALS